MNPLSSSRLRHSSDDGCTICGEDHPPVRRPVSALGHGQVVPQTVSLTVTDLEQRVLVPPPALAAPPDSCAWVRLAAAHSSGITSVADAMRQASGRREPIALLTPRYVALLGYGDLRLGQVSGVWVGMKDDAGRPVILLGAFVLRSRRVGLFGRELSAGPLAVVPIELTERDSRAFGDAVKRLGLDALRYLPKHPGRGGPSRAPAHDARPPAPALARGRAGARATDRPR